MYFVRMYKNGCGNYDPRQRTWAVYHCSVCGEDTDIDVTRVMSTFQFDRDRKCPYCGCVSPDDKEKNLKAQLNKLTTQKSRIQIEIDKIERELNEIEVSATKEG